MRTPSETEVQFIVQKCRYVPKEIDIYGDKDPVIRKVIQMETKQEVEIPVQNKK